MHLTAVACREGLFFWLYSAALFLLGALTWSQVVFPLQLCGAGCGLKTLLSFCILCFEDRQNHCLGSLKVYGVIWINVLFCRNFFMQISVCLTQECKPITFLHGLYPCWPLLSYVFRKPLIPVGEEVAPERMQLITLHIKENQSQSWWDWHSRVCATVAGKWIVTPIWPFLLFEYSSLPHRFHDPISSPAAGLTSESQKDSCGLQ